MNVLKYRTKQREVDTLQKGAAKRAMQNKKDFAELITIAKRLETNTRNNPAHEYAVAIGDSAHDAYRAWYCSQGEVDSPEWLA